MTQNYSKQAQQINSKRFWRENWWLVAFGYSVCCGVSNVTKAQSVNTNPPQSSWCTLFSNPWTFTTVQCFGLPAVSGFLDSHMLLSSPSTPTLILASTLLSAMSKQSPQSIQAASGSTLSALRWTPFARVAINLLSTLVLENVISAPCAPLFSIYMSMAQLLAHFSFFLMAPL